MGREVALGEGEDQNVASSAIRSDILPGTVLRIVNAVTTVTSSVTLPRIALLNRIQRATTVENRDISSVIVPNRLSLAVAEGRGRRRTAARATCAVKLDIWLVSVRIRWEMHASATIVEQWVIFQETVLKEPAEKADSRILTRKDASLVVQEIIKLVTVLGVMKMERRPYAVITATRSDTLPATAQQSPRTEMTSQVLGTRCNAVPESKTSLPIVS